MGWRCSARRRFQLCSGSQWAACRTDIARVHFLQVDRYAGYNRLIAPGRTGTDIRLAHCWAHAWRKLVEITRTGSTPIAEEGVKPIGELYSIEAELRGLDADARLAGRQARSAPLVADMRTWLRIIGPVSRASRRSAKHSPISPNTGTA